MRLFALVALSCTWLYLVASGIPGPTWFHLVALDFTLLDLVGLDRTLMYLFALCCIWFKLVALGSLLQTWVYLGDKANKKNIEDENEQLFCAVEDESITIISYKIFFLNPAYGRH